MQLVSARIWTQVAVSISYDGNHYTTGASRDKCDIMNIISNKTFNLHNSLLNNDTRYMKVSLS